MQATSHPSDSAFWTRHRFQSAPASEFLHLTNLDVLASAAIASEALRDALVPEADPYLTGRPAIHCVHFGDLEILRHSYEYGGLSLTISENSNSVLVDPHVDAGPEAERQGRIQQLAARLFRGASFRPLRVMPFRASDESMRMSNNEFDAFGSTPGRIDAAVHDERIVFVVEKSEAHSMPTRRPPIPRPELGWLGPSLKAAWDANPPHLAQEMLAEPFFRELGPRTTPDVDPSDTLFWRRWVDEELDPARFLVLHPGPDVDSAMRGSGAWLNDLLRPEAGLYGPGRFHWMHRDPHRLVHRYDVSGLSLLIYEGEDEVNIRVSTARRRGEDGARYVARILAALFRSPPEARFTVPKAPDERMRFELLSPKPPQEPGLEAAFKASMAPQLSDAQRATGLKGALLLRMTDKGPLFGGIHISAPRPAGSPPLFDDRLKSLWDSRGVTR